MGKEHRLRYTTKLDTFFDVLSQNPHATADEVEEKSIEIIKHRKGSISELRAISLISEFKEITKVEKASPEEDQKGIDLWVFLEKELEPEKIAVQVKSSGLHINGLIKRDIETKNDPGHISILILPCGPQLEDDEIRTYFHRMFKKVTGITLTRRY